MRRFAPPADPPWMWTCGYVDSIVAEVDAGADYACPVYVSAAVSRYAGRTSQMEPHGRPRALLATRGPRRDAHGLQRVASQRAVRCIA